MTTPSPAGKAREALHLAWAPPIDTLYDYQPILSSGLGTLKEGDSGGEVAIVGAGVAGVVAAFELMRIGITPVIYEASDRIGGRCYSKRFTQNGRPVDAFSEMGAMRVPLSSQVFFHYASMLGLHWDDPFPDPGKVPTLLYYRNQPYVWNAGTPAPEAFSKIQFKWEALVLPLLRRIFAPLVEGDFDGAAQIWQEYIDHYKDASFYEVIRRSSPAWSDCDAAAFGALGIGSGGFDPLYRIGFLEILRLLVDLRFEDQKLIHEGIDALPRGLCNLVIDTPRGKQSLEGLSAVHRNTRVISIEYTPGGDPAIIYTDQKSGAPKKQQFRAVIVTTTTRALQRLGLTIGNESSPILEEPVRAAIRNVHLNNSSKMFLRTKTKFWLDPAGNPLPDMPQMIQTDELPRAIYLLNYPQTENGVVILSYTWGDDSNKLMAISPEERFPLFKQAVRKIHPGIADHLVPMNDEIFTIDWEMEGHYNGGFKLSYPGQEPFNRDLYFQYQSVLHSETDRGVYLAGDGVSWAGGWIEGALHTGLNAAAAAAKRLGARLPENSPLSQDRSLYNY